MFGSLSTEFTPRKAINGCVQAVQGKGVNNPTDCDLRKHRSSPEDRRDVAGSRSGDERRHHLHTSKHSIFLGQHTKLTPEIPEGEAQCKDGLWPWYRD